VHKKERPKWRFKVNNFIKQLDKVENNELALELLEKIYEVLCYGCHYVIFSSDDPFASIRISQEDIFNRIVRRKFADGFKREAITSILKLMAANKPADSLLLSLLQYINTPDSRLITIEECNKLQQRVKNGHKLTSNELEKCNSGEYYIDEKINILVKMAFYCYLELSEYEKAGDYFMSNYEEYNDEVKLYILLWLLYGNDLKENWLSEYEKAIRGGIKPRERLTKMYEYIIKENKLPDYMY